MLLNEKKNSSTIHLQFRLINMQTDVLIIHVLIRISTINLMLSVVFVIEIQVRVFLPV